MFKARDVILFTHPKEVRCAFALRPTSHASLLHIPASRALFHERIPAKFTYHRSAAPSPLGLTLCSCCIFFVSSQGQAAPVGGLEVSSSLPRFSDIYSLTIEGTAMKNRPVSSVQGRRRHAQKSMPFVTGSIP